MSKHAIALRYRLQGMQWYDALRALNIVEHFHVGYRKDGLTPSKMHQIETTNFVLGFQNSLMYPERTVVCMLLHDTPEDTLFNLLKIREEFGHETESDVSEMTKEYEGRKKDNQSYFDGIVGPVATVCKGVDRIHNMSTMAGVFGLEKQKEYTNETREWFFAFLKRARREYPQQELIYEQIKFILKQQCQLFESANSKGIAL